MSELSPANIQVTSSGAGGRSSTAARNPGPHAITGKTESSSGKTLPVQPFFEPQESPRDAVKIDSVTLSISRDLRFIVYIASADPIIQVFDSETGELIRQIPSASVTTYPRWDGAESLRLFDAVV
jgi:hypothetical protein